MQACITRSIGWSEEAQDSILHACAIRIADPDLLILAKARIKKNSGFHNDGNFAPLLGLLIGLQGLSTVRTHLRMTGVWFSTMENALNVLKDPRNTHAHSHFVGSDTNKTQHLVRSPAVLLTEAQKLYDGLLELENDLRARGYC